MKLYPAGPPAELQIFGFSEFLAASALLMLVFNLTDARYRFRIAVAPFRFRKLAYAILISVGVGALINDGWAARRWLAPSWGLDHASIQIALAFVFLATVLFWIYFAFIKIPTFSRLNSKSFASAIYQVATSGSPEEVGETAKELVASANSLVGYLRSPIPGPQKPVTIHEQIAHDIFRILASRRLAAKIASDGPSLLVEVARCAKKDKKHGYELAVFINSVIEEMIRNEKSIIYYEVEEFREDFFGFARPVTTEIFGDYDFVEALSHPLKGPLDLDFRFLWSASPSQYDVYCKLSLIAFCGFAEKGDVFLQSRTLRTVFDNVQKGGQYLYRLSGSDRGEWESPEAKKFRSAVEFVQGALKALKDIERPRLGPLRRRDDRGRYGRETVVDDIARACFELACQAASVSGPKDLCWYIHYNIFWSDLFSRFDYGPIDRFVFFKFSRLMYDEIQRMHTFPNFLGAKILGLLLNIFGLSVPARGSSHRVGERALAMAAQSWARKNFHRIWLSNRRVAEACLLGGVSFDEANLRLVKAYADGIEDEPSREFLYVEPAMDGGAS